MFTQYLSAVFSVMIAGRPDESVCVLVGNKSDLHEGVDMDQAEVVSFFLHGHVYHVQKCAAAA